MKKTQNLNLNLLEERDHMDEAAFNENARLVDEAVHRALAPVETAESALAAVAELAARMDAAVGTVGKDLRVITSLYCGGGSCGETAGVRPSFNSKFCPVALFVTAASSTTTTFGFSVKDCPVLWTNSGQSCAITWNPGQIRFSHANNPEYGLNKTGIDYYFIILGYEE